MGFSTILSFFWLFLGTSLGAETRPPIVFVHGLGTSAKPYQTVVPLSLIYRYFGIRAEVAETPFAGKIEDRAQVLVSEVARLFPNERVHLVAHSMGGLDARFALSKLGLDRRVLSLTTISTPHRGSSLAEWVVEEAGTGRPRSKILNSVLKAWGTDVETIAQLTRAEVEGRFNPEVRDQNEVRYQSLGFYVPAPVSSHSLVPIVWLTNGIMASRGEPLNDGFVSPDSARWGKSLGVFPSDHYAETGPVPFRDGVSFLKIMELIVKSLSNP